MFGYSNTLFFRDIPPLFTSFSIGFTLGMLVKNIFKRTSSFMPITMNTFNVSDQENQEYKMVLVIRTDIKMGKGKACAQCSHAAVQAYKQARKSENTRRLLNKWSNCGQPKIVVKVESEEELLNVMKNAKENGLISVLIRDAGKTQVESGTKTVVSIGPGPTDIVDKVTKHLKLY